MIVLVILGLAAFLIGLPVLVHIMSGKWWAGPLMFVGCAFLLFMMFR